MDFTIRKKKTFCPEDSLEWGEKLHRQVLMKYHLNISYHEYEDNSDTSKPLRFHYLSLVDTSSFHRQIFRLETWFYKEECTLSEFINDLMKHQDLLMLIGDSKFIDDILKQMEVNAWVLN